jgi:RNA polymerase sigma factor (sigma-70 family)
VDVTTRRERDTMPTQISEVVQHLRRAILRHDEAGLTDGQLLVRFIEQRDEAAVAALVRRHGPMVWGVCRRILRTHHDAEDAFQATFLVLIRKAGSVRKREMVGNWLYGVAHQTALKARAMAAKQFAREKQVVDMPEPAVKEPDRSCDLQGILDQELSRLPDKYRVAIVMCDLQGTARKVAARQLGLPEGTVAGRLTRGRAILAKRLARHGLAVTGGTLAAALSQQAVSAGVPSSVLSSTIKAVTLVAAGNAATVGLISAKVVALTEGVVKAMFLTKLKAVTAVLFMVLSGFVLVGGVYTHQAGAQQRPADQGEKAPEPLKDKRVRPQERAENENEGKQAPLEGQANANPKVQALLNERLEILRKAADGAKQLNKQGQISQEEMQRANLRVYKAELDLSRTPKDRTAILEKIVDVYKEQAERIKQLDNVRAVKKEEMHRANVRIYHAQLDLFEAPKDRIAILEKIVDEYKEMEKELAQLEKRPAVSQEDVREARLSRLEAEIALERERAKLVKSPK